MTMPQPSSDSPDDQPAASPATSGRDAAGLTNAIYPLLLLLALGLLGWGIWLAAARGDWSVLPAGALGTIGVLAAWPIAASLSRGTPSGRTLSGSAEAELTSMRRALEEALRALRAVEQNSLISERAKQVAFRERDRAAIRKAIEEDLNTGDYAGARQLADAMEASFGYKAEADHFRAEIAARQANMRGRELDMARHEVDRLCREERWADAFAHADAAIHKHGGEIEARLLRTRVEERRQTRKVELVKAFHAARLKPDPDEAMDLLKRLDAYLTPEEGQHLADSAREVFKGRLLQLRDEFSRAMHGHDYDEALRIGATIKRDFPNSQLAREVREHEPRLREAAGVAPEE